MTSVRFQEYWLDCGGKWDELAGLLRQATGYLVFNPGLYGAHWHARRLELYPPESGGLLGIGLNPGPYGMGQTGIPFTDIKRIRERLPRLREELEEAGERLEVPGLAPSSLQPYLKLRHEASSVRVFRFLEIAFGDAEHGLTQLVFANPCSLLFIDDEEGKNRTPADFRTRIRKRRSEWSKTQLQAVLDRVRELRLQCAVAGVRALDARGVILLGRDVQQAIGDELRQHLGVQRVVYYPHPARAVPEAWSAGLTEKLREHRLL
ncbi:MAG: hypothetical protein ACOYEP_09750 [Limnochordia bacterium]|jgi:single-strand selective monofunctional uracil DNA glycosylase